MCIYESHIDNVLLNMIQSICELPPKLYCPKMEYLVFLRFKGPPSFYKGFDQTFTSIRAVSRSHRFELMAAAMAKIVKIVPGCARISTVTRRSDKGAKEATVAAQAAGVGAVAVE